MTLKLNKNWAYMDWYSVPINNKVFIHDNIHDNIYPTALFQLFCFIFKERLLTTTTLLLLEGSVKVTKGTSTFVP